MRENNGYHIYDFMDKIIHLWIKVPELRLGQLLSNVLQNCGQEMYYIEDDELIERIKNYVEGVIDGNKNST
jgi:hypothetical protein